jgi:hypothetical protein
VSSKAARCISIKSSSAQKYVKDTLPYIIPMVKLIADNIRRCFNIEVDVLISFSSCQFRSNAGQIGDEGSVSKVEMAMFTLLVQRRSG